MSYQYFEHRKLSPAEEKTQRAVRGALSRFGVQNPTQAEPIPGRESDMMRNDAGGFTFRKDLWTRLSDFIVLGTEGGTYYAGERTHTYRNIAAVSEAVAQDAVRAVDLAVEISTARPARAPKNYPALYVVAAALAGSDLRGRQAAAGAVPKVARTTDHLAHLFGYFKMLKGKPAGRGGVGVSPTTSRVVARAWTNWFTHDDPNDVAYRVLKSRQRKTGDGEPFSPGDLLRLAHPTPADQTQDALFRLVLGKMTPMEASGHFAAAKAFYEAQLADTPAKAVRAINAYHVPWEFLPDQVLTYAEVWEALVPHLGMTALIRNLSRMTQVGALRMFGQANRQVVSRLSDPAQLHRARIHPFDLMLARRVYCAGRAQPNPRAPLRTWTPIPEVTSALDTAYQASFSTVETVPGRLVVGVDCSGSMRSLVQHGGTPLGSAYHVSSAIAQILVRTWSGDVWPLEFAVECQPSKLLPGQSLGEIFGLRHSGGGTDCSAPIRWALANRVECDAFVLLTDSETWAGQRHCSAVLEQYRRTINPAARVVVVSTTAAGHSVKDPSDPGVLNVAGFDSALPVLIAGFTSPARTQT